MDQTDSQKIPKVDLPKPSWGPYFNTAKKKASKNRHGFLGVVSLPLDFFPIGESGKSNGATTYSTCAATSSCSRHQSNTGTHRNGQAKSEESWYLNVRVSHELNQSSIINHQSKIIDSSIIKSSIFRT